MPYQAIENYAIIGNMRSAALVGLNGSIDWFCFPHFDSPSVFASILDENKGGYSEGIVEIVDYMPVGKDIVDECTFAKYELCLNKDSVSD